MKNQIFPLVSSLQLFELALHEQVLRAGVRMLALEGEAGAAHGIADLLGGDGLEGGAAETGTETVENLGVRPPEALLAGSGFAEGLGNHLAQ